MRKCSNSTNSMFEEQEAKSYTEETGVFANYHIWGHRHAEARNHRL